MLTVSINILCSELGCQLAMFLLVSHSIDTLQEDSLAAAAETPDMLRVSSTMGPVILFQQEPLTPISVI
jgi:hypothetical protein